MFIMIRQQPMLHFKFVMRSPFCLSGIVSHAPVVNW